MDDCIFCRIVEGGIPSYKVYEDSDVLCFLDINPYSFGHVLVVSKSHFINILDIPEDIYLKMCSVVRKISLRIEEILKPEGILINQNNGSKAGQDVFHAHIHIKPIYESIAKEKRIEVSKEDLEEIVKKIAVI